MTLTRFSSQRASWRFATLSCLLLLLAGCTTSQSACGGCKPARKLKPQVVFATATGALSVNVELACTSEERSQGLMHRKTMAANAGMLFVFPFETPQSFWMKNTYIALDMIHINKNKEIVGIVENAKPHTQTSRTVGVAATYVLEVNAFYARKHGIRVGQKIKFVDVPGC